MYHEWLREQTMQDQLAMDNILSTKAGREAYSRQFNTPMEDIPVTSCSIPNSVFTNFYTDECKTADDIKEQFFKLVDAVINTAQIQGKSIKSASDICFVMGHFGHINQIKATAYYTDKLTTKADLSSCSF